MTLREKQSLFAINFAKLILRAQFYGYEVTLGEVFRTPEQQQWYVSRGLSKTLKSKHLNRLAGDLNLFVDGKYQTTREPYEPLAAYWKELHPSNVAGFDWGWDANHFEMQ